jgi:hypothetical protein
LSNKKDAGKLKMYSDADWAGDHIPTTNPTVDTSAHGMAVQSHGVAANKTTSHCHQLNPNMLH